jgi:hypothetical protein
MGASILLAIFSKTWLGFNFGRLNDAGVRELVEFDCDCVSSLLADSPSET